MAQPNPNTIHQAFVSLADQAALLPNVPALNQPQLIQHVQQLLQQNAQILLTLDQINQRLQNMEDLHPMRSYNGTITLDNPLQYPPAIVVAPPFPETKAALQVLTVAHCIFMAGALGLAPLGPGATVGERSRQISDYLGCALRF